MHRQPVVNLCYMPSAQNQTCVPYIMFILPLILNIHYLLAFITFKFFTQSIIKFYVLTVVKKLNNKLLDIVADLQKCFKKSAKITAI